MLDINKIELKLPQFQLGPVSLSISEGEHYVLLGPSGSGKSLLLEIIAGFRSTNKGSISVHQQKISDLPPHLRKIGFVFQKPALFPHLTVEQNIAFPLREMGGENTDIKKSIRKLAGEFDIEALLSRKPAGLSGGEAQRVSLARVLAMQPGIILLDEPLSALDVQLKSVIRQHLNRLNRDGITIMHVTHDYEETVRLATMVGIMQNGQLVQNDKPLNVFRNPGNSFVAHLTGLRNYFRARLTDSAEQGLRTAVVHKQAIKLYSQESAGTGIVLVDEDHILLSKSSIQSSAQNNLEAVILSIKPLPNGNEIELDAGFKLFARISDAAIVALQASPGNKITASFKASTVRFLPD